MRIRFTHDVVLDGLEPADLEAAANFLHDIAGDSRVQVEEPSDAAWEILEAAGVDPNRVHVVDVETAWEVLP